jgi:triphosphoribosyl-dephospho-CoA synthase
MDTFYKIASFASTSILCEFLATPKPGLVDRVNAGAHKDMDIFTFASSTATISPYFVDMARIGHSKNLQNINEIFLQIQSLGKLCDKSMFDATNSVNVHKGQIFSLSILCACAGFMYANKIEFTPSNISKTTAIICKGILTSHMKSINIQNYESLTYGEKLYINYGIGGARESAQSGYAQVVNFSLPILSNILDNNLLCLNDALVQTLLHLMTCTTDINILGRHNFEVLQYTKDYAYKVLELGGMYTKKGKAALLTMDDDFITKKISPGGCADLLCVTYMFYLLERNMNSNIYI